MATKNLSLLLVIISVFVLGKAPAQINLTQGLKLYFPFTGNANDASGNGNVATVNGPVLIADRFGAPNAAYRFDGIDDFISFVNGPGMKPQYPFSFSCWMNLVSPGTPNDVNFMFCNDYTIPGNEYYGAIYNAPAGGLFQASVGDSGPVGPTSRNTKTFNTPAPVGSWHHYAAIVYSANNMRLFLDCTEQASSYSGTGTGLIYSPNGQGMMGRGNGGFGEYFLEADLDEVRFYDRALTDDEIAALYFYPVYPPALLFTLPTNNLTLQCGSTVNIDATFNGIISYNWADGPTGPTRTFTTPGTYIIEAFDGCLTGYDTVVVTANQGQTNIIITAPPAACIGEPTTLTAAGAQNYTWSPATGLNTTTGPIVTATLNDTTTYTIIGTGACGNDTTTITINAITAAPAGFTYVVNECTGAVVTTNTAVGASGYLWQWDNQQSTLANPLIQFMSVGDHDVVLITNPGTTCADTVTTNVTTLPAGEETVYIPNAFTPNGDGRNDVFIPFRGIDCIEGEFYIYNRWGEKIFYTDKPFTDFWNGEYKDYAVPIGIYAYRLITAGGKEVHGMIAVIR